MLVIVRHGRTEANARGLLLGRADPRLDDEGLRQAARLGAGLAGLDVARVVTSPLLRCRASAEAIVAGLGGAGGSGTSGGSGIGGGSSSGGGSGDAGGSGGPAELKVEVDERWIELDYGELDGTPVAEVPAADWANWRSDVDWAPAGGESLSGLGRRVRAACDDLAADAEDADVVVVTHVSPIKAAVAWALGVGDEVAWRTWVAPASITRIGVAGGRPILRSFNELAHLEG